MSIGSYSNLDSKAQESWGLDTAQRKVAAAIGDADIFFSPIETKALHHMAQNVSVEGVEKHEKTTKLLRTDLRSMREMAVIKAISQLEEIENPSAERIQNEVAAEYRNFLENPGTFISYRASKGRQ